jgi:hypothetical protein
MCLVLSASRRRAEVNSAYGATCVPRRDNGVCGDLMTDVRYERMLELIAYNVLRWFADSHGFGLLPDGSPLHFPVPGNVLDMHGMAHYTYGGVGESRSAVYAPVFRP